MITAVPNPPGEYKTYVIKNDNNEKTNAGQNAYP
jgi:hypothetical protein